MNLKPSKLHNRILAIKVIRKYFAAKVFGEDVIDAVTKASMLGSTQVSSNFELKAAIKAEANKIYFEILRTF